MHSLASVVTCTCKLFVSFYLLDLLGEVTMKKIKACYRICYILTKLRLSLFSLFICPFKLLALVSYLLCFTHLFGHTIDRELVFSLLLLEFHSLPSLSLCHSLSMSHLQVTHTYKWLISHSKLYTIWKHNLKFEHTVRGSSFVAVWFKGKLEREGSRDRVRGRGGESASH